MGWTRNVDDDRGAYVQLKSFATAATVDGSGLAYKQTVDSGQASGIHPDVSLVNKIRESTDQAGSLDKVPVVVILDTSGSMGEKVVESVLKELVNIFDALAGNGIPNADVMVMIFNDNKTDGPLGLVTGTQFETTSAIVPQIANLYPVGNGGGNEHEDSAYALWYVLNRTKVEYIGDSTGRNGFVFLLTDERAWDTTPGAMKTMFGDGEYQSEKVGDIINHLYEQGWITYLLRPQGTTRYPAMKPFWTPLLFSPEHFVDDVPINELCKIIGGLVAGNLGLDVNQVMSNAGATSTSTDLVLRTVANSGGQSLSKIPTGSGSLPVKRKNSVTTDDDDNRDV